VNDREALVAVSEKIAAAIGKRDVATLRKMLAPGFVHRTHGEAAVDVNKFLAGVAQIPGEIMAVRLDEIDVDVTASGALVTGIQYAQLRLDGQVIEDRRGFVDWFVKQDGEWRIQAAVDLPAPSHAKAEPEFDSPEVLP
jgi:Domain of unknown function (DUF4440)